jgi:uncharacterized membrane protein YoaK (UPF0700 family)
VIKNSYAVTSSLHPPTAVFSSRHAPSWWLLAFAAGAVNAGALLACQRFVSHVTGNVTLMGADAVQGWLGVEYALVLASFVLGAATSVLAIEGRLHRGRAAMHHVPLLVVAAIIAAAAFAGHAGTFGAFGGSIEQPPDFVLLAILGFAMGLQNATVATSTGMAVRTTHMTGPATDFGIGLAVALVQRGEEREYTLRAAWMRGVKILCFAVGGVAMVPLAASATWLAFLLPVFAIITATGLSFRPETRT